MSVHIQRRLPFVATMSGSQDLRGGGGGANQPPLTTCVVSDTNKNFDGSDSCLSLHRQEPARGHSRGHVPWSSEELAVVDWLFHRGVPNTAQGIREALNHLKEEEDVDWRGISRRKVTALWLKYRDARKGHQ